MCSAGNDEYPVRLVKYRQRGHVYLIYNEREYAKMFVDFYKTVYRGWFSWTVVVVKVYESFAPISIVLIILITRIHAIPHLVISTVYLISVQNYLVRCNILHFTYLPTVKRYLNSQSSNLFLRLSDSTETRETRRAFELSQFPPVFKKK